VTRKVGDIFPGAERELWRVARADGHYILLDRLTRTERTLFRLRALLRRFRSRVFAEWRL
jgi:hypothetical protein